MEKLFTMKEAREILRVSTKTIQRWDKAGKIRCVRTPGNRRLIPESEILRIIGEIRLPFAQKPEIKLEIEPKISDMKELARAPKAEKPKQEAPRAELPRHVILDAIAPAGLVQRTAFGDLLSAAAVLKNFTPSDLAARARCPESVAIAFCERMSARSYIVSKNGAFELRVEVTR